MRVLVAIVLGLVTFAVSAPLPCQNAPPILLETPTREQETTVHGYGDYVAAWQDLRAVGARHSAFCGGNYKGELTIYRVNEVDLFTLDEEAKFCGEIDNAMYAEAIDIHNNVVVTTAQRPSTAGSCYVYKELTLGQGDWNEMIVFNEGSIGDEYYGQQVTIDTDIIMVRGNEGGWDYGRLWVYDGVDMEWSSTTADRQIVSSEHNLKNMFAKGQIYLSAADSILAAGSSEAWSSTGVGYGFFDVINPFTSDVIQTIHNQHATKEYSDEFAKNIDGFKDSDGVTTLVVSSYYADVDGVIWVVGDEVVESARDFLCFAYLLLHTAGQKVNGRGLVLVLAPGHQPIEK